MGVSPLGLLNLNKRTQTLAWLPHSTEPALLRAALGMIEGLLLRFG
jgi:hypothetical protein